MRFYARLLASVIIWGTAIAVIAGTYNSSDGLGLPIIIGVMTVIAMISIWEGNDGEEKNNELTAHQINDLLDSIAPLLDDDQLEQIEHELFGKRKRRRQTSARLQNTLEYHKEDATQVYLTDDGELVAQR